MIIIDSLGTRCARSWFKRHAQRDHVTPAIKNFLRWSGGEISVKKINEFYGLVDPYDKTITYLWLRIFRGRGVTAYPYKVEYGEYQGGADENDME